MKILISGGHLTPALALIDFIKQNHQHDELVFVGRLYSQSDLKQLAQEENELKKRQVKFIHLNATRTVTKKSLKHKLLFPFLLTKSISSALSIFNQEQPDIFMSFGGYLAIPLAIAAKLTHTKILTHEQTRAVGIANRFIAKFADQTAISYPSSATYFPHLKTTLTGNPIRSALLDANTPQPNWISTKISKPILLVMGGSQGSKIINQVIKLTLQKLTTQWIVIHLCGNANTESNYRQQLQRAKKALPVDQQQSYFVKEWANDHDMSWIYHHATAAISRAGANSVMELTIKNIPTIFIPLPNSHHDEQLKNAQALSDQHAAIILAQDQLTPDALINQLNYLQTNRSQILKNIKSISQTTQAVNKIYQLLLDLHAA